MVLPLPLTAFEEYMLADDRPQWPMTFFLRLELRGPCDPAALASALDAALARHPLLASRLADDGRGGLQWVAGSGVSPPVSYCDTECEIDFPAGQRIELRAESGVRLWVRAAGADEWTLWLQFHHACCDGIGALQFVGDLLAAYRLIGSGRPAIGSRPVLDARRLRRRGSFGGTWFRQLLRAPQELLGLLGAIEFFSHRPPSLLSAGAGIASEDDFRGGSFPCWIRHRFTAEQTARLRRAAHDNRATLNDLLLADLFSAIDAWFAEHRPKERRQFVRIMVPTNLRAPGDRETPAANRVSMVNLDRRPARYASRRRLLRSVSLEMAVIKRCRLGITMHHVVRLARRLGKLAWLLPDDRCLCTCVLSNLGDAGEMLGPMVGDYSSAEARAELMAIEFLPPIRPLTAAAVGVSTFRGRATITLHFDARMPAAAAQELLDAFVGRLEQSCDEPISTRPVEAAACRGVDGG